MIAVRDAVNMVFHLLREGEEGIVALSSEILLSITGWRHDLDAAALVQRAQPVVHQPALDRPWQKGNVRDRDELELP